MDLPVSDQYYFVPDLPLQQMLTMYTRWHDWHDGYEELASSCLPIYPRAYSPGTQSWDDVSSTWQTYYPDGGALQGPFLSKETDNGTKIVPYYYPTIIMPPPGVDQDFAMASAYGYLLMQMWAIRMVQQRYRFVIGHFGRKRGD